MKKKYAVMVALVLAFGLLLSACASKDTSNASGTESPAATASPAASTTESKLKVAFVTPQATGDNGPVDDIMLAVDKVKNDFGIEVQVVEALNTTDQEDAVRSLAAEGYDVIFTLFQQFVEPVKKVAPDYPNTKFVMIYSTDDLGMSNVVSYAYDAWETSYAAGVLAASMSSSGKLGHVVGYEDDTIVANSNAFLEGAKTINANAQVTRINAASFEDPAKGKEVANQMMASGIDVIFTDAARTSLGVIQAAQESKTPVYVIGDNADHSKLAPSIIIGDNIYGYGDTLYNQIKDIVGGKFEKGVIVCSIENGKSQLATYENFGSDGASQEVIEKYKQATTNADKAIQDIKDGKIKVEKDTNK